MSGDGEFDGWGFAVGAPLGQRSFDVDRLGRLFSPSIGTERAWRPGVNESTCRGASGTLHTWHPGFPAGGGIRWGVRTRISYSPPKSGYSTERYGPVSLEKHSRPKPAPVHDLAKCSCGFYAYWRTGDSNPFHRVSGVHGVVRATGRVVMGEKGMRAEKAEVVALALPEPWVMRTPLTRWAARLPTSMGTPLGVCGYAAGAAVGVGALVSGFYALAVVAVLLGYLAYAAVYVDSNNFDTSSMRLGPRRELYAKVRRNYPNVRIFRSERALRRRFPADPPPAEADLGPDDPGFWDAAVQR